MALEAGAFAVKPVAGAAPHICVLAMVYARESTARSKHENYADSILSVRPVARKAQRVTGVNLTSTMQAET